MRKALREGTENLRCLTMGLLLAMFQMEMGSAGLQ